ncbi:hypothetical protein P7C71_g6110, partial [Lecanoromycetidae sp. Uapishka_2]
MLCIPIVCQKILSSQSLTNKIDFEYEQGPSRYAPTGRQQQQLTYQAGIGSVDEDSVERSEEDLLDEEDSDVDDSEDEENEDIDTYEDELSSDDSDPGQEAGQIPHWQIWETLLDSVKPTKPEHGYNYEPATGLPIERDGLPDPEDRTSFFWPQKGWANIPGHRPSVLERFDGPRETLNYKLGIMKFEGMVVVDWEGHPVRKFMNIPVCISSNVEGWRLEAWMRADSRLRWSDIVARLRTKGSPNGDQVPICQFTALSKRAQYYRQTSGHITWANRSAETRAHKDFINSIRRAEMTREQIASNRALPRGLTPNEHARLQALTKKNPMARAAIAGATKASQAARMSAKGMTGPPSSTQAPTTPALQFINISGNPMNAMNRTATGLMSPANQRTVTPYATRAIADQAANVGNSQMHHSQMHYGQMHPSQVHHSQVHPSQMHPSQMHPSQMHPSQMHPSQMHPSQMNPSQMNPSQMHLSQMQHSQPTRSQPSQPEDPFVSYDEFATRYDPTNQWPDRGH